MLSIIYRNTSYLQLFLPYYINYTYFFQLPLIKIPFKNMLSAASPPLPKKRTLKNVLYGTSKLQGNWWVLDPLYK